MSKYLKKPSDSTNFIANGVFRAGATLDDPVRCDGKNIQGDVVTQTGAGAISVEAAVVKLVTTGANALTLAAGTDGQIITIVMITDGGDGSLVPATFGNGTTITFNDAGDSITLVYVNSKWYILANNGCTIS